MRKLLLLVFLAFPLSAATFKADDGVTVFYEIVGKGSPVVLLSGGPGFSPEYLRPIAETLAAKRAFVLLHQRGSGRSTMEAVTPETVSPGKLVADLETLRRELKLEKLTLAGHSFGGMLAMLYAAEHPDRVESLILIDSGGPSMSGGMSKFSSNLDARFTDEDRAAIKLWSSPEKRAENRKLAVLETMRAKTAAYFADRSKAKAFADALDLTSYNDQMFRAVISQMQDVDSRPALKKVNVPVLIIHGRQDPLETGNDVQEALPGSKLEWIENAGHFPWIEQPEAFYAVLGAFLTEKNGARAVIQLRRP